MPNNDMGAIGVDDPVAGVIRRYFPEYPESTVRQMMSDPNAALLAALVRQGENYEAPDFDLEQGKQTNASTGYFADQYVVTSDGPRQEGDVPTEVNGNQVDLGTTFDTFDLRFTDAIDIAFQGTNNEHRMITYRAEDSPIVGKEATTRYVWVSRADEANEDPRLFLEAY